MLRIPHTLSLPALFCLSALALAAQSIVPKKIAFTGVPQYAGADLLAVSGLHPGTPIDSAAINAGAQALINTGFFSHIGFTFDNVTLTYTLLPAPASDMLTASYDNLVWWTPAELAAELHRRHPLFTAKVPQTGTLQDTLIADITDMLTAKGITGTVAAIPSSSSANSMTIDSVRFMLSDPPVRIHAVQVDTPVPDLSAAINTVCQSFLGQGYSDIDTPPSLQDTLKEAIQNEGYLDVTLDGFQRSAPVVGAHEIDLDLAISAHPGERYRIAAVNWPGSPLLSTADFTKISSLKVGAPPSLITWRQTDHALEQAYSTRGYMAAKTNIEPRLDHTAHLVSYTVTVTPGEQYAFRTLTLTGVTDKQRQDFLNAWKMQPGMIYDAGYVNTFLQKNSSSLHSLDGYSLSYRQIIDDNVRKVDLQIELKPDARLR